MLMTIFNQVDEKIGTPEEGGEGPYRHTMGGTPRHAGAADPFTGRPALPILEFDLADPDLGIAARGLTRLPVYYPFHTTRGSFCYRVANTRVRPLERRLGPERVDRADAKAFDDRYPSGFRFRPITIEWRAYDPMDPSDFFYRSVFSSPDLSPRQERTLVNALNKYWAEVLGKKLFKKSNNLEEADDNLPRIDFPTGSPAVDCPNRSCRKYKEPEMQYFFLLEPEEQDDVIYTAIAGGDSGRLTAVFCPACRTVRISNQCT
jgi:hypothetical protein